MERTLEAIFKSQWQPYIGPEGGTGWTDGDEIVYDDEPPGPISTENLTDEQLDAFIEIAEEQGMDVSSLDDSDEYERPDRDYIDVPPDVTLSDEHKFDVNDEGVVSLPDKDKMDAELPSEGRVIPQNFDRAMFEMQQDLRDEYTPESGDFSEYMMDGMYMSITEPNIEEMEQRMQEEGVADNVHDTVVAEAWTKWAEPKNVSSMLEPETYPLHQYIENEFGISPPEQVEQDDEYQNIELSDEERKQFEIATEVTQDFLEENFGDTVTLSRGIRGGIADVIAEEGSDFEYDTRGIESWTTDTGYADSHAGSNGTVIYAEVDVDDIPITSFTSPGRQSTYEQEFILASDDIDIVETKEAV